jgi:hypothetical protein
MPGEKLERALYDTLRYFSLFDMPLTATQLWRCLIIRNVTHFEHPSLPAVQDVLRTSPWLQDRLEAKWGYFTPKGHREAVERRLTRHRLAQLKWKLTSRLVRWLRYVPFVRMIAGSGSLSLNNTTPDSDLDLLIIVKAGRLWTARLMLLLLAQLSGRRRTYWDVKAPDKLCLNHYLTDESLAISPAIQNIYTAINYTHLVPLYGYDTYQRFLAANHSWLTQWVSVPDIPPLPMVQAKPVSPILEGIKRLVEAWLMEPIGNALERWAERVQRRVIERHTEPGRAGRIVVSSRELAFHPDSKADVISAHFVSLTH